MIEIIEVSPNNEEPVAKRLAASIRAAWPEVANSPMDRVTIAVGLQTLREIDLLVTIELSEPRALSSRVRRDGSRSPKASIQAAAIIIEVKQLDESRFTVARFKSLAAVMAQTLRGLSGDSVEGEAALLKACAPERFAWDYVLIDEAQDWTDAERDFIRALYGSVLEGGFSLWDACDDRVRDTVPSEPEQWRFVQYDSCRGLEGWVTVAYGLDQLAITKHKHPNLAPGETDTPENVVRRWLMIALTRAVNTLIITVADPAAPIVRPLRAAAAELPSGVVEWTTGADCAAVFRPPA